MEWKSKRAVEMSSQVTLSITSDITEIKLHERKQLGKKKKKHQEKRGAGATTMRHRPSRYGDFVVFGKRVYMSASPAEHPNTMPPALWDGGNLLSVV